MDAILLSLLAGAVAFAVLVVVEIVRALLK